MADQTRVYVLLGPTASGKSSLAIALAERIGGDIVSVDSMQVYRGMDIGTAKPTTADRNRVAHHLIDLVHPDQSFTVAKFVEAADEVLRGSRVPLVLTGGTPLYYKALFEGLFESPPADPAVRERLRGLPNEELFQRLAQVDFVAAARIHRNDTKRLIRALEVHELSGRPISALQTEWSAGQMRHQAVWFGLAWDREVLSRRINRRVREMLDAGWVNETAELLECYGELSPTAAEATGYRELTKHLRGDLSLDDAAERIKIATRQLARRQMKWFRRWSQVRWIPGDQPTDRLLDSILNAER